MATKGNSDEGTMEKLQDSIRSLSTIFSTLLGLFRSDRESISLISRHSPCNFLVLNEAFSGLRQQLPASKPNIQATEMKGDGDSRGRLDKLAGRRILGYVVVLITVCGNWWDARTRRSLANAIFQFCTITSIALSTCYAAFVIYLGVTYTGTWVEKLRLLPLLILSLAVPMLGSLMLREKYHVELQSKSAST